MTRLLALVVALLTASPVLTQEPIKLDCAASQLFILNSDREFYEKAAASTNVPLSELLAGACRAYDSNHYKSHEFALGYTP